jgi:hypothetical protein
MLASRPATEAAALNDRNPMTANAVRYPLTVLPVRYAVTFAGRLDGRGWPSAAERPDARRAGRGIADRAIAHFRAELGDADRLDGALSVAGRAAKAYAAEHLTLAERHGVTELFLWDVPAMLEAWQRPATQGEADDLAAFQAAAERHGLTEAELADAITAEAADAELAEAAAAADGTLGARAVVAGPLTDWELDLAAERALSARAAACRPDPDRRRRPPLRVGAQAGAGTHPGRGQAGRRAGRR